MTYTELHLLSLKKYLWSPGAGFIPIISTKGINQIEKGNCKKSKYDLYLTCNPKSLKDFESLVSFNLMKLV